MFPCPSIDHLLIFISLKYLHTITPINEREILCDFSLVIVIIYVHKNNRLPLQF